MLPKRHTWQPQARAEGNNKPSSRTRSSGFFMHIYNWIQLV